LSSLRAEWDRALAACQAAEQDYSSSDEALNETGARVDREAHGIMAAPVCGLPDIKLLADAMSGTPTCPRSSPG
jgi:hypothetical protein